MLTKMTWNPTYRQLRQFGLCALVAMPVLGWTVVGRPSPVAATSVQAMIFGGFAGLGLLASSLALLQPRALKPAFVGLMVATMPIGMVLGEVLLAIVFFALFTPIALFFRLTRRDALCRRFEPDASTYWTPVAQSADVKQYFRQS